MVCAALSSASYHCPVTLQTPSSAWSFLLHQHPLTGYFLLLLHLSSHSTSAFCFPSFIPYHYNNLPSSTLAFLVLRFTIHHPNNLPPNFFTVHPSNSNHHRRHLHTPVWPPPRLAVAGMPTLTKRFYSPSLMSSSPAKRS